MQSKMLDAYIRWVTQLTDEAKWDHAEALAAGLPHIAVALQDSQLHSSTAAYLAWCEKWVQGASAEEFERWCSLASSAPDSFVEGKPSRALTNLGLVRSVRAGVAYAPRSLPVDARSDAINTMCRRLIAAFEAWRTALPNDDARVTENLARLGVLR